MLIAGRIGQFIVGVGELPAVEVNGKEHKSRQRHKSLRLLRSRSRHRDMPSRPPPRLGEQHMGALVRDATILIAGEKTRILGDNASQFFNHDFDKCT